MKPIIIQLPQETNLYKNMRASGGMASTSKINTGLLDHTVKWVAQESD